MKALPHSTECEKSALGCVILDSSIFPKLGLALDDFYHEDNRKVYAAMQSLYGEGLPIDFVTLTSKLGRDFDDIGGITFLSDLMNSVASSANYQHYCNIVKEKKQLRGLISLSAMLNNKCLDDPNKEALIAVMNNVQSQLSELVKSSTISSGSLDTFIEAQVQYAEAVRNGEIEDNAIKTGFPELDKNIGGLRPGNLVVVAGRPGAGKTAITLDFILNAIRRGNSCAYYSLEMTCDEISRRLIAKIANVGLTPLINGNLSSDEILRVKETLARDYLKNLFISEENITPGEIETFIDAWNVSHDKPLKVLAIDHLQLCGLHDGKSYERRDLQLGRYSSQLKDIAKRKKLCVVLLSQLNRSLEARGKDERLPKLSDLRDSGAIEQDADIVMAVYRKGLDTLNQTDEDSGLLLILKNRNGQVGAIDMQWVGSRALYRSKTKAEEHPRPVTKPQKPKQIEPVKPFDAPFRMVDQDTGREIFLESM